MLSAITKMPISAPVIETSDYTKKPRLLNRIKISKYPKSTVNQFPTKDKQKRQIVQAKVYIFQTPMSCDDSRKSSYYFL
jgi:hypothetical protein